MGVLGRVDWKEARKLVLRLLWHSCLGGRSFRGRQGPRERTLGVTDCPHLASQRDAGQEGRRDSKNPG